MRPIEGVKGEISRVKEKEDKCENRPSTSATAPKTSGGMAQVGRALRVLVVEDNPVNRRILTTMLKRTVS